MATSIETQLLAVFGIKTPPDDLKPEVRTYSAFIDENKCGVLLGVLRHAVDQRDSRSICTILDANISNELKKEKLLLKVQKFLDKYVRPFYKHYRASSSRTPSVEHIIAENEASKHTPTSSQHKKFSEAVKKRDQYCCFCWDDGALHAAHIIAQKNIRIEQNIDSILRRSKISNFYDVKNGICLCAKCHDYFDKLVFYVNTDSEPWCVEFIEKGDDGVKKFKIRIFNSRKTESVFVHKQPRDDGVLDVQFGTKRSIWPSKVALNFHRAACLIWKMAGGAEIPTFEEFDDDEWDDSLERMPYDTGKLDMADKMDMFFDSLVNADEELEKDSKV